jgi:hypothetical protein
MSLPTLEERVAALEKQVAQLMANAGKALQPKDWRSTVGMFTGDEVMKQIDEAGRRIREADRRRARRQRRKTRQAKK